MQIYLLRHCEPAEFAHDDVSRPLSAKGEEQALIVSKALRKMNVQLDAIISSPFTRTKQTSEILQKELEVKNYFLSEFLVPGSDPRLIISLLNSQNLPTVLLVGHEPQLRAFLSFLISTSHLTGVMFKKGSLCYLSSPQPIASGQGTLVWLLTNEQMQLF